MKRFSKFLIIQLLFLCAIFGSTLNVYADEVKQKQLYTLEDPTWIRKTGFSKGLGHDCQDLGIILPANVELTIKQVNPNFKGNLTLRLYNDNNQHEVTKTFNQTAITVSNPYSSVPLIETIYGGTEKPKIEYTVTNNMQTLPIYRRGQNQQIFFTQWDKTNAPFALVIDDYFQMLVPQKDKAYMKNMRDFSSIDQLILYYRDIFEYYNKLSGITFDSNIQTDKNVPNKYFIKADKSGPGGGYYGGNHTAETSDSLASFWLTKGWGALHEIGHGYQHKFNYGEVWNNIFAHSYQKRDPDVDIFKNGWLYDYGRKSTVDNNMEKLWHQDKKAFNTWGLREQLYGLVLLKDKAGDNAFSLFNQECRKLANTSDFNVSDYKQFDLVSKTYGEASKLDFTPTIESFGGEMTSWQKELNRYKNYKPVAPLNEVVSANKVSQIQQSLKLETPLSLVTTDDLSTTGLKGSVTLNFKIDDFNQIKNQSLYIMNGDKQVKKVIITNPTINISELPIGIYTIYSTVGSEKLYTIDTHYLKVKDSNNNITLNYNLRTKSVLLNQEIDFLGIADNLFASATVDLENQKLNIKVLNKTPHDYFPNEQYVKIEILDQNNNVTYTKVINGTNVTLENSAQDIKEGYKIRTYHSEPSRLKIRDNKTCLTNNKTNTLIITNQGLKNESLNQNLNEELVEKINDFALKIKSEQLMAKSDCAESKIELKLAIDSLTEPLKSELLEEYKELLPHSTINKENPNEGSSFTFDFKGLGDWLFAELNLDLTSNQAKIDIKKGEPHVYFDESYASVLIQDNNGQTVFYKDFIGTENNDALVKDIPLKEGYYLTIKHQEFKNRLSLTNETKNLELDKSDTNSYQLNKNELRVISENEIPDPNKNPYLGKDFNFTFKGLGDWLFAELNLDLTSNQAKIDIKKGEPHVYFDESYASVLIQDNNGQTVFYKDFIGTENNDALVKDIPLKEGYYLTVKHQEFKNRLSLTNKTKNLSLPTDITASYQIAENELKSVDAASIPIPNKNLYLGKNFNFSLKGAEEWLFAELKLDLNSNQATIDIKNGDAHYLVKDNYASIIIKDENENVIYSKDFIGNAVNDTLVKNIPIKPGYFITIKHKEANLNNRLSITNLDNKLELEKDTNITYKITDTGLVKIKKETNDESKEIKEWGTSISYKVGDLVTYKGLKYKCTQAHKSIFSWEPGIAITLWSKVY